MAERGARNITLFSPSSDKLEVKALSEDLRTMYGTTIDAVRGNIIAKQDVIKALETASSRGPLRGIVQAGNILRVGNFLLIAIPISTPRSTNMHRNPGRLVDSAPLFRY